MNTGVVRESPKRSFLILSKEIRKGSANVQKVEKKLWFHFILSLFHSAPASRKFCRYSSGSGGSMHWKTAGAKTLKKGNFVFTWLRSCSKRAVLSPLLFHSLSVLLLLGPGSSTVIKVDGSCP